MGQALARRRPERDRPVWRHRGIHLGGRRAERGAAQDRPAAANDLGRTPHRRGRPALGSRAARRRPPVTEPQAWLIEPDPAIIRAGLVQPLGEALGAALLDPEIAYLTSAARPDSPWARAWQIVDWMPFNLKALKQYVRTHNIGRITVKKRGHAMTPEALLAAPQAGLSAPACRPYIPSVCSLFLCGLCALCFAGHGGAVSLRDDGPDPIDNTRGGGVS
ncbi:MAG: hypothetical protein IPM16_12575 [Chloroflexi bacterium]|nr:hypothetical protein [Chloroflexota bacterium]